MLGVNFKLNNSGKEEMMDQSLFEETTEIADAKIKKIIKTLKTKASKTLSKTEDSKGWLWTGQKA